MPVTLTLEELVLMFNGIDHPLTTDELEAMFEARHRGFYDA